MPDQLSTEARGTSPEAGPTREQWDAHKHTIIRLYRAHKLKEVQQIMQSTYDFYARYVRYPPNSSKEPA